MGHDYIGPTKVHNFSASRDKLLVFWTMGISISQSVRVYNILSPKSSALVSKTGDIADKTGKYF